MTISCSPFQRKRCHYESTILPSNTSSVPDLQYIHILLCRMSFATTTLVSLCITDISSHHLLIICSAAGCASLALQEKDINVFKNNNVGRNICRADILWAGFRLAGSLIRKLFCHFFPHVLTKLQPFFSITGLSASLCFFYPHVSLLSPPPSCQFMSAPEPSDCLKIVCVV